MRRSNLSDLAAWKTHPRRKPLVLRGARQVGKTAIVRMLGESAFERMLEINLESDRSAATLFTSKEPSTILPLLEARYGVPIVPGETLLFLDEIQAAPELLSTLRYFHEKLAALHVVAAGSLLDFARADHEFSMPVGRIEYLHLGPMTFEEFLLANERDGLAKWLQEYELGAEVPAAIHDECLRWLRRYFVIGGMPASIEASLAPSGARDSAAEQQSILSTFRDDFAKYTRRADHPRIEKIFARLPRLVGSTLKYASIDREDRSRDLGRALDMLCRARVAHKIHHTAANGIPLGAEVNDRAFKVLFMDVGLLCRSCGLNLADVEVSDDILLINAGAVAEQFVGQHLLFSNEPYVDPELHCWMREKNQSNAEVDYVIAVGPHIVPVEVKAGRTGTLRSLQVFLQEKRSRLALRFNTDIPSRLDTTTTLGFGTSVPFRLLSLPLYMVGQARRLCAAEL